MAKPKRYWMRLTAEFDDGATYTASREVTGVEIHDVAHRDVNLLGLEFLTLQEMLNVGLARKGRG